MSNLYKGYPLTPNSSSIYEHYTVYRNFEEAGRIEHFEKSQRSTRTLLYDNFQAGYHGSFNKSSYGDSSHPIHTQFSWLACSQNTDHHSQCRVPFFQPILPWLSFQIQPEEDFWLCWLPCCLMGYNNYGDAFWGLEIANLSKENKYLEVVFDDKLIRKAYEVWSKSKVNFQI